MQRFGNFKAGSVFGILQSETAVFRFKKNKIKKIFLFLKLFLKKLVY